MLYYNSDFECVAVSFETSTFRDLQQFLKDNHDVDLKRIDPEIFLKQAYLNDQYINLVVKDWQLRQQVTQKLDNLNARRFSYVHPSAVNALKTVPGGVLIYPNCTVYLGVTLGEDLIVHAQCCLAHESKLGKGCFLSGLVVLMGSAQVGDFCFLGTRATVHNNVLVCNNTVVGANANVRHNIDEPGVYVTKLDVVKMPDKTDHKH